MSTFHAERDMLKAILSIEVLIIAILSLALIVLEAFWGMVINKETLKNSFIPSAISASSIFSGLLATYLVNKIITIRNERISRLPEIDQLSKKLTQFRKILANFRSDFFVNFWRFNAILQSRPDYSWTSVSVDVADSSDPIAIEFWRENYAVDMFVFLAFEEIVGEEYPIGWTFSKNDDLGRRYSLDELVNAYYVSNDLWYYFDHKWHKAMMHQRVSFTCRSLSARFHRDPIMMNAGKIDPKYSLQQIDRKFLSELGSEFHDQHLPRLISLVRRNQEPYSHYFIYLVYNLLLIVVGGVLLPLTSQFFAANEVVMVTVSAISLSVLLVGILAIGIGFFRAWGVEGDVTEY